MTKKLEKLRENVEAANALVNESFVEYDLLKAMDKESMNSNESSDHTLDLVKKILKERVRLLKK